MRQGNRKRERERERESEREKYCVHLSLCVQHMCKLDSAIRDFIGYLIIGMRILASTETAFQQQSIPLAISKAAGPPNLALRQKLLFMGLMRQAHG